MPDKPKNMQKGIAFLKGTLEDEANFTPRYLLPEKCGIATILNVPNASKHVFEALNYLEHRGENGWGLVSFDDKLFHRERKKGRVSEYIRMINPEIDLPGNSAIGQTRYATHGSADVTTNIPPILIPETKFGPLIIAHNGTLINQTIERQKILEQGGIFQTQTDSELIAHYIAKSKKKNLEDAIIETLLKVQAGFSIVIMTPKKTIVAKDPFALRPLAYGRFGDGDAIFSENYLFDQFTEARYEFDLNAGQMLIFENGTYRSIQYAEPQPFPCCFEWKYFENETTAHNGIANKYIRQALGFQTGLLFLKRGYEIDTIVPIPKSGIEAAIGFRRATSLDYNHYLNLVGKGRSFTEADQLTRIERIKKKFSLENDKVKNKKVLLIDDTIVRGNTMHSLISWFIDAGAKEVHVAIPAPPIVDICPFGFDFQDHKQLVAFSRSPDEIRKYINADSLTYLDLKGQAKAFKETINLPFCNGCFGGKYPINYDRILHGVEK